MTDFNPAATRTPWHLWVVGALAVLWNAFGCFDYLMTQTLNEDYLASFTEEQIAAFTSAPAWSDAGWAIGVWSGLAGAILLVFRSRAAMYAFGLSLIGMVVGFTYTYGLSDTLAVMGDGAWIMPVVVALVGIFFFIYSRAQAAARVLR